MTPANDFTTTEYAALLDCAKRHYRFQPFTQTDLSEPVIFWRHDCDVSLNRAVRLAQIEQAAQIKSTYFLNLHSEFYHLLEKDQTALIHQIIDLGHHIGLHFDVDYYAVQSEDALDALVEKEASWLNAWFGVPIDVVSFHNPSSFILRCERPQYGGLINTYSHFFKTKTVYCSDSNGYWRHQRLRDLLESKQANALHILTHAEWWQEEPMPPRDRIVRAVQGRAAAVLTSYDTKLVQFGRENLGTPSLRGA